MAENETVKKTTAAPKPKRKSDAALKGEIKREALTFIQKLKQEPLVKVHGAKVFQKSLGDYYTFLVNGYSVTIYFDGSYQEFPQSIAELLQRKLDDIALSISPVNEDVKL
jgi:hypothetical protein